MQLSREQISQFARQESSKATLTQNIQRETRRILLVPGLAFLLTGCFGQTVVLKQVKDFQESISAGAEATTLYYKSINDENRRLYYLLLKLYPECMAADDIDTNCKAFGNVRGYSPLKQDQIPSKSLNARIQLLNSLATYAKALGNLATDSSPEDFNKGVEEVTTNLSSLNTQFRQLNKPDNRELFDNDVEQNYIKPIARIIRLLGNEYLTTRKWETIRGAIKEASPEVNILLKSLEDDLGLANTLLPVFALSAKSNLINYYNENRERMTPQQRESLLLDIDQAKLSYDAFKANDPAEVIKAMRLSHDKLVAVAADGGTPKSIGEFKAVLTIYVARVLEFKNAVRLLGSYKSRAYNEQ